MKIKYYRLYNITENTMTNLIQDDLNNVITGETEVTLIQALARIAAQFHDPAMRQDRDTGAYNEVNQMSWSQRMAMQSLGNMAWRQMYDTGTDKNGRERGISHKLDKARSYAKQLVTQTNGTEIDLEAMNRAADWIERLEAEFHALDEMYHAAAAVYEAATGDDFKPYQPWTTAVRKPASTDSDKMSEVKARMQALGINMPEHSAPNTNGVETSDVDAA